MFRLTLLGAIDLRHEDGRRVGSILSQPKRLALLSLLALESPRLIPRQEAMLRLWPDSSEDRGRNALRQALHYLTRSLGPEVVTGKGSEAVGLNPEMVECDAALLLEAAAEGRHDDALALYGGELLAGFHYDNAPPEFEHWLDRTRRKVREAAASSGWEVAAAAEAAGDRVGAGAAARQACELGGWGEPAVQRLLALLIRTGDVHGARETYEEHAKRLRSQHGLEPDAATRKIVASLDHVRTVVDAGAEVDNGTPPEADRDLTAEPAAVASGPRPGGAVPWIPRKLRWPAAAGLALVLLVPWWMEAGPVSSERSGNVEGPVAGDRPTLYIQPIRDLTEDASQSDLAGALGDELAAELIRTDGFRVMLSPSSSSEGGAGVALQGSVRRSDGDLHFSMLVLDPSSNAVLDRFVVRAADDAPEGPEGLAGQMALKLRAGVGQLLTWRGLEERGISREALEAIRTAAEEEAAARRLRKSGALEAAAAAYRAADSLLAHAEAVDPIWAEPTLRRAELAMAAMWLHLLPPNRDLDLAHREAVRGLAHAEAGAAAAPEDSRAFQTLGLLNNWAAATAQDPDKKSRFVAEAEVDLLRAVHLDPHRPEAWNALSEIAERRGDFAAAYHRARRAYAADRSLATSPGVLARLFTSALEVGDAEAAGEWCQEAHRRNPGHYVGPYCDLLRLAWAGPWTRAAADSFLEAAVAAVPDGPQGASLSTRFQLLHAVALARAGETGRSREALVELNPAHSGEPDVLELAAWVRTALGDGPQARALLAAAANANPGSAGKVLESRRFDGLSSIAVIRRDE